MSKRLNYEKINKSKYCKYLPPGSVKKFTQKASFLPPEYYLKKNIKTFYDIKIAYHNFIQTFEELKIFLKLNKEFLNVNTTQLDINMSIENNILFQNEFQKGSNIFKRSDLVHKNLKEYCDKKQIFVSSNTSLFYSLFDQSMKEKDSVVFVKFLKLFDKMKNKLIRSSENIGLLSYEPIFRIGKSPPKKINNKNNLTYVLLGNDYYNSNQNTNLDDYMETYKKVYQTYNYKQDVQFIKNIIETNYNKYKSLSIQLSQDSSESLYHLLINLLELEFTLITLLLHYNNLFSFDMMFSQDVQIKDYITKNMTSFENFSDTFSGDQQSLSSMKNSLTLKPFNVLDFFNEKS